MNATMPPGDCPRCGANTHAHDVSCGVCGLQFTQAAEKAATTLMPIVGTKVPHLNRAQSGLPAILAVLAVLGLSSVAVIAGPGKSTSSLAQIQVNVPSQHTPVILVFPTIKATTPLPAATLTSEAATAKPTEASTKLARTPPDTLVPAPSDAADVATKPQPTSPQPIVAQVQPAKLLPGVGSTAADIWGWSVRLDGVDKRPQLWSNDPYTTYKPKGTFWLVYLVNRNDGEKALSLSQSVDFTLKDIKGTLYSELSDHGRNADMTRVAQAEQANPFSSTVQPHRQTSTLLVFDLPVGTSPSLLVARLVASTSQEGLIAWKLGQN